MTNSNGEKESSDIHFPQHMNPIETPYSQAKSLQKMSRISSWKSITDREWGRYVFFPYTGVRSSSVKPWIQEFHVFLHIQRRQERETWSGIPPFSFLSLHVL
jgi:hypothetical protein